MQKTIYEAKRNEDGTFTLRSDRYLLDFLYGYYEEAIKLERELWRDPEKVAKYEANFAKIKEALGDE